LDIIIDFSVTIYVYMLMRIKLIHSQSGMQLLYFAPFISHYNKLIWYCIDSDTSDWYLKDKHWVSIDHTATWHRIKG
jgi:hypothetical protein